MARALHEVLQEQVVGALLGVAENDLRAVKREPSLLADVVVGVGFSCHRGTSDRKPQTGPHTVLSGPPLRRKRRDRGPRTPPEPARPPNGFSHLSARMTPLYCAPAGTRHSPGPHRRIGTRPAIFSTWQSSSGTFARLTLERPTAIVAWTIVIGTAFRVGVAAAGLDFDHSEAHYIASARVLDLSYFDHPPLAFWITWATRTLTGSDSRLAVRAPFIAMFVGTTWMMYRLGAELFDERAGALAALILNLSPLFTISFSAWAQPDGPLTFFVLAAILLVVRLERATATAHRLLLWLGIGACLGLALLSKYPAVLIAAGLLLFAITSAPHRRWFVEPGPYLGAVLALVLFSPVLVWNARHGWISLGFQGGRAFEYEGISLRSLLDSIGGQAVLIGPWIWVPCLQAGVQGLARGPRDWRTWFLATVGATPVVLFTAVALWVS